MMTDKQTAFVKEFALTGNAVSRQSRIFREDRVPEGTSITLAVPASDRRRNPQTHASGRTGRIGSGC